MRKDGSKMASRTRSIAPWTILSLGEAILSGLVPPFGLGISIRLAGLNWKALVWISLDVFSNHAWFIPSRVSSSTPGVMLPAEDLML